MAQALSLVAAVVVLVVVLRVGFWFDGGWP